jgi:autotransporter family porin
LPAPAWRRLAWPAAGVTAAVVLLSTVATVAIVRGCGGGSANRSAHNAAAGVDASTPGPSGDAGASVGATPSATASSGAPSGHPSASRVAPAGGAAPARFATLGPGAALPSGAQCATWVRAKPYAENKGANRRANQVTGHTIGTSFFSGDDARANTRIAPRVDGQFTGTTGQILRWAACKWGVDEDLVFAQAAIESWWQQATMGDWTGDASRCAPGRGLGVDGRAGQCPESFGILQNRYPYEKAAWPGVANSTAMNADLAYAIWRVCFEGYEGWLNTVERGQAYAAGDAWGCVGRWFSGRWHVAAGDQYIGRVRSYLDQRVWQTANFQQP